MRAFCHYIFSLEIFIYTNIWKWEETLAVYTLEIVICVNKENELGLKDNWTKSGIWIPVFIMFQVSLLGKFCFWVVAHPLLLAHSLLNTAHYHRASLPVSATYWDIYTWVFQVICIPAECPQLVWKKYYFYIYPHFYIKSYYGVFILIWPENALFRPLTRVCLFYSTD